MLSQNLKIERNVIGVLLLLTGILSLIAGIYGIQVWLEYLNKRIASTGETINYSFLFKNFHLMIIIGALLISSGLLLIFKKKSGWVISIALICYHCISYPIFITRLITDPEKIKFDSNTELLLILLFSVLVIIHILSFLILILPKFRNQFNVGPKQYWIAFVLFAILQLDRILF